MKFEGKNDWRCCVHTKKKTTTTTNAIYKKQNIKQYCQSTTIYIINKKYVLQVNNKYDAYNRNFSLPLFSSK